MPKISVILTTYKRPEALVLRAVNSVLNQSYNDFELIIVDDSPCEYALRETIKNSILAIDDKRIRYIQNETNIGACASRNKAIDISTGDFIIYVDDDDELIETCLEKRLQAFTSDRIGLVYSDCYIIEKGCTPRLSSQKKYKGHVFDKLFISNFVFAFPMLRKECFDECGQFDTQQQSEQDLEMWLRVSQKYDFNFVDEPLAKVYYHDSERISTNSDKRIQGYSRINDLYSSYLKKHFYAYYRRHLILIPPYLDKHTYKLAIKEFFLAFIHFPFDVINNLRYIKLILLSYFHQRKGEE